MLNYFKRIIKKNRIKLYLKYLTSKETNYFKDVKKSDKKVIVGLAADYSNLGDVGITYAQTKFLEDVYPDYKIVDFPISETFNHMKELEKLMNEDDIITLVGGGNTGDHYDSTEYARQFFIKRFSKNRIFSFPQTIDFSNTKKGKYLFGVAQKVYSKHPKLVLMAREEKSFHLYKSKFPNNEVWLYPDIVLYIDKSQPKERREGITFTLRTDEEKNISSKEQEKLVNKVQSKYSKVTFRDTQINKTKLSMKTRIDELNSIWKFFRGSELVITDRLHGMIFCAITQTPCIAINNSNKKVSLVFEKWLTTYNYICMIDNFNTERILSKIEEFKSLNSVEYNAQIINDKFNELSCKMKKI